MVEVQGALTNYSRPGSSSSSSSNSSGDSGIAYQNSSHTELVQHHPKTWLSRLGLRSHDHSEGEVEKTPLTTLPDTSWLFIAIHICAIGVAVVVVSINLVGFWIGKELQGVINRDVQKQLAIQIAAKWHELLIVACLTDILFTNILKRLSIGDEMPFAMLATAFNFKDLSYFISPDFRAIWTTSFRRKELLLPLITIAALLSVLVGPSSAVAMIPRVDSWPKGKVTFVLNTTRDQLWPNAVSKYDHADDCQSASSQCGSSAPWRVVSENLFSYWGHESLGGVFAMPENVVIPSRFSLRNMEVRFRGRLTLFQPEYTVATVQSAVVANALHSLRLAWLRENMYRCADSRGARICSAQNIIWSVDAPQPVVYTSCNKFGADGVALFTNMKPGSKKQKLTQNLSLASVSSTNSTQLEWLEVMGSDFEEVSAGVVVRLAQSGEGTPAQNQVACSIKAQWADSTIGSSWEKLIYSVTGVPAYFVTPFDAGSTYQSRKVTISPSWAAEMSSSDPQPGSNQTAFNYLYASGATTVSDTELEAKVEAILAVLVAESLAQIQSKVLITNELASLPSFSPDSILRNDGHPFNFDPATASANLSTFTLKTTATGYAYGIITASGPSTSTILALGVLMTFLALEACHLAAVLFSKHFYVKSWRTVIDLVALACHSEASPSLQNTSCGVHQASTFKIPVTIATRGSHAELVFRGRGDRNELEDEDENSKTGLRKLEANTAYA